MKRLEMKDYNTILTKKEKKYQRYNIIISGKTDLIKKR